MAGLRVNPLLLHREGRARSRSSGTRTSTRRWDEAAQEIVLKQYVNLGIAAATPRGLIVPNIKDARDAKTLRRAGRSP